MLDKYRKEAIPALKEKFGFANVMQVPKLDKIVLNMGVGKAIQDAKLIDEAVKVMRDISGQKPVVTRAKKAISNFKLRQGQAIGVKVTLRGDRMYEFLTVWLRSQFRVSVISGVFHASPSTVTAITRWASRSRSCSLKSTGIK